MIFLLNQTNNAKVRDDMYTESLFCALINWKIPTQTTFGKYLTKIPLNYVIDTKLITKGNRKKVENKQRIEFPKCKCINKAACTLKGKYGGV